MEMIRMSPVGEGVNIVYTVFFQVAVPRAWITVKVEAEG